MARSVRPSPLKSPVVTDWGTGSRREGLLGRERAVAVAQQHRHVIGIHVCRGQVGDAVAVEVARGNGVGTVSRREGLLGRERAVAVAQQHRHVIGRPVRRRQVGQAVAVEVARGNGSGTVSRREGLLGRERAVAVAQQHRHVIGKQFAVTRSVRPSPLKSPVVTDRIPDPAAKVCWAANVPSPLPSSTDTSSE